MNLPLLPEPTARRCRSSLAILRSLAVALGLAGIATDATAAERPANAAPALPVVTDVVLARAALAAIDADADLKGTNLLVSVVDRVAVVGGPVSSGRQSQRVEQVVRAVPGIADVRNTCFVSLGPDPLLLAVAERLGSSLPPRPTFYELPGVLTPQLTPPSPAFDPLPSFPDANTVAIALPGTTIVVRKPSAEAGVLGGPVGGAASSSVSAASPLPATGVLTSAVPLPANPGGVLAAAHDVRKTEPRFAGLKVELRDGTLVVGGSALLPADAWDFAQKLRLLPGVTRVAIAAVAAK